MDSRVKQSTFAYCPNAKIIIYLTCNWHAKGVGSVGSIVTITN